MTAAADDALSHDRVVAIHERQFQAGPSSKIDGPIWARTARSRGTGADNCSAAERMAPMSQSQERQTPANHCNARITCRNLVATGDDFIRQYSRVIKWLMNC
jgi:hypothetical protein